MFEAEKWAKSIGAVGVRLNSGALRNGAHEFYRALDIIVKKNKSDF